MFVLKNSLPRTLYGLYCAFAFLFLQYLLWTTDHLKAERLCSAEDSKMSISSKNLSVQLHAFTSTYLEATFLSEEKSELYLEG